MQSRPIWQVVGAVVVFAALQEYFENPNSIFTLDRLLGVQYWLEWIVCLLIVIYALNKAGNRLGGFVKDLVLDFPASASTRSWPSVLGGIAVLVLVLATLEHQQPFFFTQDDNLMQFLPVILQGCHSLFQGIFPTWNPYQLLGTPTTSVGVYSLTYPITYVSYLLSRYVFRNEFLTIETYCIAHIVLGYFALYSAVRCHRVRPSIAVAAALCAVLSGWSLIATRSWFYVGPVFLYMPLLIVGVSKLTSGTGDWKWIGAMSIVIALFFHAGNVQFWVYGLLFLWVALVILWACRLIDRSKIFSAVSANLLGIALACPLLVPQFIQTRNAFRIMVADVGTLDKQWQAFLIPGPWIHAFNPANSIDPDWRTGGLAVYSGTIFVLLAGLLVPCFFFYRIPRNEIGRHAWFFCAIIAFLAAIGLPGVVWPIMFRLPLLSKFRIPIKFLAFFNVFVSLAGAMVLEGILRRVRWSKQLEFCAVTATVCLVAAAATMRMPTWYAYGVQPYSGTKPLVEQVADSSTPTYRVMALTYERSPSPRYWEYLPHNLGTIYGVPAFHGYDPLIRYSPSYRKAMDTFESNPLETLREYGVAYVLEPTNFNRPKLSGYGGSRRSESSNLIPAPVRAQVVRESVRIFADDEISIRRISDPRPLAFADTRPSVPLALHLRADGFDLDTSSLTESSRVIANFLWYPEIRAQADGKRISIGQDSYQRIVVALPQATKVVKVRFVPAWWKGFAAGAVAALAGMILGFFANRGEQGLKILAASAGL